MAQLQEEENNVFDRYMNLFTTILNRYKLIKRSDDNEEYYIANDEKLLHDLCSTDDKNIIFSKLIEHRLYLFATTLFCLGNVWYYDNVHDISNQLSNNEITNNNLNKSKLLYATKRYGIYKKGGPSNKFGHVMMTRLSKTKVESLRNYHPKINNKIKFSVGMAITV
jgi:hypothetical protein